MAHRSQAAELVQASPAVARLCKRFHDISAAADLVGSVGAPQLLNGFVGRPGQLNGQVHPAALVNSIAGGVKGYACAGSVRHDGDVLQALHEAGCRHHTMPSGSRGGVNLALACQKQMLISHPNGAIQHPAARLQTDMYRLWWTDSCLLDARPHSGWDLGNHRQGHAWHQHTHSSL